VRRLEKLAHLERQGIGMGRRGGSEGEEIECGPSKSTIPSDCMTLLVKSLSLSQTRIRISEMTVVRRHIKLEQECGPMPNVMVALPNIGGALCSTPQSLDDAHY